MCSEPKTVGNFAIKDVYHERAWYPCLCEETISVTRRAFVQSLIKLARNMLKKKKSCYSRLRIGVLVELSYQSWHGDVVERRINCLSEYLPTPIREFFYSKYLSVFSNAIQIENYFIFYRFALHGSIWFQNKTIRSLEQTRIGCRNSSLYLSGNCTNYKTTWNGKNPYYILVLFSAIARLNLQFFPQTLEISFGSNSKARD